MNSARTRRRRTARLAFTLIEVLVALILTGVAAAGLASALGGDRRLRDLAAAQLFAAHAVRDRLERLAALPCLSNASGSSGSAFGLERWSALAGADAWNLTDSLMLFRLHEPVVIRARVACPG